jgi:hypothetical protein
LSRGVIPCLSRESKKHQAKDTLHRAPCTVQPAPCNLHPAPRTPSFPGILIFHFKSLLLFPYLNDSILVRADCTHKFLSISRSQLALGHDADGDGAAKAQAHTGADVP